MSHDDCIHLHMKFIRCRLDGFKLVADFEGASKVQTLVLYTYSNSDPEYERNLHFFVQHGVYEADPCDYVITVQQVGTHLCSVN